MSNMQRTLHYFHPKPMSLHQPARPVPCCAALCTDTVPTSVRNSARYEGRLQASYEHRSLTEKHSGHYMYPTVVTICTAQWLIYVPQLSVYVPHSGHYMYRTVVTICTAQWSLYVQHSGHYMYRTVVTICTTRFNTKRLQRCLEL